ncbi:unnamed protein product [Cylindrotheca closterium]|uniref:TFIIB-type domain-containing protein n=1 Tax=Cylindrotheca closterium TaxID=2856 RepID=A0AAD2G6P6_9STRA|nr:unnamed protein product [Cylindrotheca closterium]
MKLHSISSLHCLMALLPLLAPEVQAFHITPSRSLHVPYRTSLQFHRQGASSAAPSSVNLLRRSQNDLTTKGFSKRGDFTTTTKLHMYNLPPGRGGGGGGLGEILKGAAGLLLTVAFFASPVGGFVLSIFNSFLLLAILIPTVTTIGFQAWQYFNTISGPCPSCGAPARVLKGKDGESQPTVCYSCGSVLQASYDNSRIDNVTGRNSMDPFGGGGGGATNSIFDIFGGPGVSSSGFPSETTTTRTTTTIFDVDEFGTRSTRSSRPSSSGSSSSSTSGNKKKPPSKKDMGEIIDAEIEEDDLPFQ